MATQAQHPLPAQLIATVSREFGEAGEAFLRDLPEIVRTLEEEWSLEVGPLFDGLSYHFVARATLADGTPAVLKLGPPHDELGTEIEALRHFDGHGIVRLIRGDAARGAILLERVVPGDMLGSQAERHPAGSSPQSLAAKDDDGATLVAASLMRRLWSRPPPSTSGSFRDMRSWFREMWSVHDGLLAAGDPVPAMLDRGYRLAQELISSTDDPVLVHGDLHHMNILSATREEWLAIDPKGHIADRCYELYAFITNPEVPSRQRLTRRLDILCTELGLDRARARDWCVARQVLNACWNFHRLSDFHSDLLLVEHLATI